MDFFEKPDITIDNYSNKIRIIIYGNEITNDIVLSKLHESIITMTCAIAVYLLK